MPELLPRGSSGMAMFVDDSAELVLAVYGEVVDLAGFKRPRPQGCGGG
jgi:hypothetical protein